MPQTITREFTEADKKYYKGIIDILISLIPLQEINDTLAEDAESRALLNTGIRREGMGFSQKGDMKAGLGLPQTLITAMEQIPDLANFFNACHTAPVGSRKTPADYEQAKKRFYWFMQEYPQFKKCL